MTIAFLDDAVNTAHPGNATTVSITDNAPASIGSGNLLLAVFHAGNSVAASSWSGPSGWTKLDSYDGPVSGNAGMMSTWWKTATGSEPSTYTFTLNTTISWHPDLAVNILQYSGVDPANPPVSLGFTITGGVDNHLTAPVGACTSGQTMVCAWGMYGVSSITGVSPTPSGANVTLRSSNFDSGTSTQDISVYDRALTASGTTPAEQANWATGQGVATTILLNPGGGPKTAPQAQLINA